MSEKLIIAKEDRRDCLVVKLDGEFIFDEVAKFENFVKANRGKNHNIAIDMKKLVFLDSSGMGSLVKLLNFTRQISGGFYLYNVPEEVRKIFEVADLISFFNIVTESEFKAKFKTSLDDIMRRF